MRQTSEVLKAVSGCHRWPARTAVVSAVLLFLTGCSELPPDMRQTIADADRAYRGNDIATATKKADEVIAKYASAPETAEAYYVRALCRIEQGRSRYAMADLQTCIQLSKRPDLTAKAYASLGGIQHDLGQLQIAASSFQKSLQNLPNTPPADQVRLRYGICLQRLGLWDEARTQFSTLLTRFPSSPYVEDARHRLAWNNPFFSIQCGAFVQQNQAESLTQKLRSALSEAWVEPARRFGRQMYLVYAGKYGTFAEADAGLQYARRVTPEAFIVP